MCPSPWSRSARLRAAGKRAGADAAKVLGVAGANVTQAPISIPSVYRFLDAGCLNDAGLERALTAMLTGLRRRVNVAVSSEGDAA